MSDSSDPLLAEDPPDRVFYATGQLLSAEDFQAEQTYHRSRLARVLSFLHGSGTAAGLEVTYTAAVPASGSTPAQEEMLIVQPGMGIDRLGRIIEVPSSVCIRLNRWYAQQPAGDLAQSLHAAADTGADGAANDGVVADLFIRYVACERGKTPAFAVGDEDALDALAPSRLRDAFEAKLFLRPERPTPPLPQNKWPDLTGIADPKERRKTVHAAIFKAWPVVGVTDTVGFDLGAYSTGPEPLTEYLPDQDPTSVFLARLVIPAVAGATPADSPVRQAQPVLVDNSQRLFVYPSRALAAPEGL